MARGKPLTGFLLAMVHSPELTAAFNDPEQRPALLENWGLSGHDLFSEGELTLERVRAAVNAEQSEAGSGGSGGLGSGGAFGSQGESEDETESGGESASVGPIQVAWWIWF
jgi:hypothetical protein